MLNPRHCTACNAVHSETFDMTCIKRREINGSTERSCADCLQYAPVWAMTTKLDGRVICAKCNDKVRKITAERAQMNMFGQQSLS